MVLNWSGTAPLRCLQMWREGLPLEFNGQGPEMLTVLH